MPRSRSAIKRAKTSLARRDRNRKVKSHVKSATREVLTSLAAGDGAAIEQKYRHAVSKIDRAAGRGVLHRNTAARKKSRLARQIQRAEATE